MTAHAPERCAVSTVLGWMPSVSSYDALEHRGWELTRLGMPLADHLAAKRVSGRGEKLLRDRAAYVGAFALMWPRLNLEDVEARHVVHYLAESAKTLARESLRVRRSHLNDFFEWAVVWELMPRNPLDRIEKASRRGTKKVYDVFNDAEIESLCALPIIDGALMRVMFDAGLRRSECVKLRPRDILPEPPPGQLAIIGAKGGKNRLIPITTKLGRALAVLRSDAAMSDTDYFWYTRVNQGRTVKRSRQIGDGSFQRWWDRCIADAGVRRRNPHMTRHTMATRWLRRGGRLETLSLVMGHASIAITYDLYGHLDTRDVLLDMAAMDEA